MTNLNDSLQGCGPQSCYTCFAIRKGALYGKPEPLQSIENIAMAFKPNSAMKVQEEGEDHFK